MKNKNRFLMGIVACALSGVMFSQSVPMELWEVAAEELKEVFSKEEEVEQEEIFVGGMTDEYNIGNGYIINENVKNRTLNTKEFVLSDGMIMVQQFTEPVHYLENGEYKEIDNSLVEETKADGQKIYKNNANSFKVRFDKESKKNTDAVEIEEDGYGLTIAYKPQTEKTVVTAAKGFNKKQKIEYKDKKYKKPVKNKVPTGEISYQNVTDNVNLTYQIKNKELQNTIIVGKAQSEYSYTFTLQSSNLQFTQNTDGSITARTEAGKAKFIMVKPYMTDSKGAYSSAVTYTLQENNGAMEITVTADSEWLNEKATFPVSIHPTIESVSKDNFDFANVFKNGETITESNYAYAGTKNGAGNSDLYLNFKIPTVKDHYQLLGARVAFDYQTHTKNVFQQTQSEYEYNVYLTESAKNLGTITSDKKPQKIDKLNPISKFSIVDGQTLTYESGIINVNNIQDDVLTLGIEQTLAPKQNEDVKSEGDESVATMSTSDSITIGPTTEDDYVAIPMTLSDTVETTYFYQVVSGIKDDYSMESFEINGMTAYVNNGTGRLTAAVDLVSVNTLSEMPFAASLVYNDTYYEILADLNKTSYVGTNFKLNFQQFMVLYENKYYLIDADGSVSSFHILSSNLYYSKDKKLYYNATTGVAYDTLGNEMVFTNGRLTEIRTQNNPTEYITVSYANDTSDQITAAKYYVNSALKYTINFAYTNDKLTSITTNADATMPETRALEYDEDGKLINVKYQTGFSATDNTQGVQMLTFGYYDQYFDDDPVAQLNYVYDNQKCGLMFDRDFDNTIEKVRNMNAVNVYGPSRCCSYVVFSYYGCYTEIAYYENNIVTDLKCVSFNNVKEVISEWRQNAKGILSVQATTNWANTESMGTTNYSQTTGNYYHKSLPTNAFTVASGASVTQKINGASLGVDNSANYKYGLIFKVRGSNTDEYIQAGIHLVVSIWKTFIPVANTINLTQGGYTYICIPCDYYDSSTNIIIKNNGSKDILIDYFAYTVIDSVTEEYTYDSSIKAHRLTAATSNLRSGEYVKNTYDAKQRLASTQTKALASNTETETTTYSYYDETTATSAEKGKIKEIITLDENNEQTEKTTYTYTGTWDNYTETATTQGDESMQTTATKRVSQINGKEYTIVTQTDENNQTATGYYTTINGDVRLEKIEYGNTREEYAYNKFGQIVGVSVYETTNNTLIYSQSDNYDENGVYIGSTYAGDQYTYGYDNTGFVTSISENGTNKLTYSYYSNDMNSIKSNRVFRKTYANGNVEEYNYTEGSYATSRYTTQMYHKNSADGAVIGTYTYNYNSNGAMTSQNYQTANGITQISYNYGDLSNREEQTLTIGGLQYYLEYTVNNDTKNNRVESAGIYSATSCQTTQFEEIRYTYNDEGQVSALSYGGYNAAYTYDKQGRLTNKVSETPYRTWQNENYVYQTYVRNGVTYTTNMLSCIDDQMYQNNDRTATYDENGYVTGISYNGNTYAYEYDALGRLTKETDRFGVETTYTYDGYNNVQKAGLTYTNGKLTAVNGAQIVYDEMGNPTTYKGNTFTWTQGRKLTGVNNNAITYAYDGNGMRYQKIVNGVETEYYYNGTQLLVESRNGNRMYYIYGVTGIEGFEYGTGSYPETYYFDKNTLGDVVAIRDESGNILAKYEYDAWGNVTVYDQYGNEKTDATFIGNVNPIRYRGYYYDVETGFYYLQTRYYDPTICRFINADNYELVAQLSSSIGQLNMYAYCGNNPIMFTDPTGEIFLFLVSVGVAFIVGTGASIISQGIESDWQNINVWEAAYDGLFVAFSAALSYTGIGLGASMAFGAGFGLAQYSLSTVIFDKEFKWQEALEETCWGLLCGLFGGAGAKNAKGLTGSLLRTNSAVAVGMVSGIRNFTKNTAFTNRVNKDFLRSIANGSGLTILTEWIKAFTSLYVVD